MAGRLKRLLGRRGPQTHFVYVRLLGHIDPIARGHFEDPLAEALEAAGLGSVTGGGSSLGDPDESGRRLIEFAGIDLDVHDLARARGEIRRTLTTLGIPGGTTVEFTCPEAGPSQDRWTGREWSLGELRHERHPAFGF